MILGILLAIWPLYAIPAAAESVTSEIALSKPWNREINPVFGDIKPVQYTFRIAGAALFASVDTKMTNSGKTKMVWFWRGLYIAGNAYLIQRSVRRWKDPYGR